MCSECNGGADLFGFLIIILGFGVIAIMMIINQIYEFYKERKKVKKMMKEEKGYLINLRYPIG